MNQQDKEVPEGKKKGKPVYVFLTPMCPHPVDKCPSPKYQPLLYTRQIALSAAGNQLPITLVAQILQWETLSSLDHNSLYVVQSQKGTLVMAQHTLQSGLQVWEEFSP